MSVNKVILLGRLGQEPELKHTPNGNPVCNFSIATSEKYKAKTGEQKETTEWHRIVVWGTLAELCFKYLHKGSQAFIEGKLVTRSWEDTNGAKKYSTEIVASSIQFIGDNKNNAESNERPKENNTFESNESFMDKKTITNEPQNYSFPSDDIPF